MSLQDVIRKYWIDKLTRDLSPFCDPGTQIEIEGTEKDIIAVWNQRGEEITTEFRFEGECLSVRSNGRSISYNEFLSGPQLADLDGLARMIARTVKDEVYVPSKIRIDNTCDIKRVENDFIGAILGEKKDSTSLIMITGDAGVGKTSTLRNLIRSYTEKYLRKEQTFLLLYVNAQGRSLSRFNEALATELNDLRSRLPYHAVATLVRNNLLIPVVDGFDELVGLSGSDDAFSSLSSFMEELDGDGIIIASARSAYFEQEIAKRANTRSILGSNNWEMFPVSVLPWDDDDISKYFEKYAEVKSLGNGGSSYLKEKVIPVFSGSRSDLKYRPLFLTKVTEIYSSGEEIRESDDLLRQIVNIYLDRESKAKLKAMSGSPILSIQKFTELYSAIAEEMWNLETREIDKSTIKFIAEYFTTDSDLSSQDQEYIMRKLPSAAFLTPGATSGSLKFEHEAFFDYFLSSSIRKSLETVGNDLSLNSSFGRSIFSTQLANLTVQGISRENSKFIISRLVGIAKCDNSRKTIVKENTGKLAFSIIQQQSVNLEGSSITGMALSDFNAHALHLSNAVISDCEFSRINMQSWELSDVVFENCILTGCVIDKKKTRLGKIVGSWTDSIIGIKPSAFSDVTYDPIEIESILSLIGAIPPESRSQASKSRSIRSDAYDVIARLFRTYGKKNPICKSDDNLTDIFEHDDWRQIEKILLSNSIISLEEKQTSGAAKDFLRRLVLPEEFMLGYNNDAKVSPKISNAWEQLEAALRQ